MARDFGANQALETAGILCVFQGFQIAQLGQKDRHAPQAIYAEFPKTKVGLGYCPIIDCVRRLAGCDASSRPKSGISRKISLKTRPHRAEITVGVSLLYSLKKNGTQGHECPENGLRFTGMLRCCCVLQIAGYLQNFVCKCDTSHMLRQIFTYPFYCNLRFELIHHHHAAALAIQAHGLCVLPVVGFNEAFLCQCFQQGLGRN